MTDSDVRLYFCYYSSSPLCTNSRFDVLFYWWGFESRRKHGCSPIENCKGLCVSLVSILFVRSCYRILIMYHKFSVTCKVTVLTCIKGEKNKSNRIDHYRRIFLVIKHYLCFGLDWKGLYFRSVDTDFFISLLRLVRYRGIEWFSWQNFYHEEFNENSAYKIPNFSWVFESFLRVADVVFSYYLLTSNDFFDPYDSFDPSMLRISKNCIQFGIISGLLMRKSI